MPEPAIWVSQSLLTAKTTSQHGLRTPKADNEGEIFSKVFMVLQSLYLSESTESEGLKFVELGLEQALVYRSIVNKVEQKHFSDKI